MQLKKKISIYCWKLYINDKIFIFRVVSVINAILKNYIK